MWQRFRPDPSHRDLGYSPYDDDRGRYASGLQRDDYRRVPERDDPDGDYRYWDVGAADAGGADARGRSRGGEAAGRSDGPNYGASIYGASGASSSQDYWRHARRPPRAMPPGAHRGHGPKGYVRTDVRLREAICDRLMDDPDIDARDITVTVEEGVVTLEGTVDNRLSKYIVEDLVDDCGGVKGIRNLIEIAARTRMSGRT